jgi:hypothetical protein
MYILCNEIISAYIILCTISSWNNNDNNNDSGNIITKGNNAFVVVVHTGDFFIVICNGV